ncbi:hypothetical protein L486_02292 [Kwoniella mangroviensis CBS 10435]|uniref:Uncharacterized protein n=1 Tax=Kwoniella mangroviensis CBS 10435 TaxID=1331196 RepID=A0A1B9IVQ7_9TREE|nr:hypothetical protein L486_02292 [Kwoniella mangroviensis CBS 10435]
MENFEHTSTSSSQEVNQPDEVTKKAEERTDEPADSQSIISSVGQTTNSLKSTTSSAISTLIDAHKKLADNFTLPEMRTRRSQVVHTAAAATVLAGIAALAYKYGPDFSVQMSSDA